MQTATIPTVPAYLDDPHSNIFFDTPPPINEPIEPAHSEPAQVLPCDIQAEMAILGSILIDPDAMSNLEFLQPDDFFRERHAWIFQIMRDYHSQQPKVPIDFITICDGLEARGQLDDIGGAAYITELSISSPTALYAVNYAEIVAKYSQLRKIFTIAQKTAELACNKESDPADVVERMKSMLDEVTANDGSGDVTHISHTVKEVFDTIAWRKDNPEITPSLPTCLTDLDELWDGGMNPGELIVIGGRPGNGKSTLGFGMVRDAALFHGAKVMGCSLEMSKPELVTRMLSSMSGIDGSNLKNGIVEDAEWGILAEASNELSNSDIFLTDRVRTMGDVARRARRLHVQHQLDMVLIDYAQLMTTDTPQGNVEQEVAQISRSAKLLAMELQIPVVLLSQLSRKVEERSDKRPMMSDLRYSGAIEQDADKILFIYNEAFYYPDTDRQNITEVITAKQRGGRTGTVELFFDKPHTAFRDLRVSHTDLNNF